MRNLLYPLLSVFLIGFALPDILFSQQVENLFQPFTYEWPAPSDFRTGAGAPGPAYWQQKVDYAIQVEIAEDQQRLKGTETIIYHNQSPHTLSFLWVQLDQNAWSPHSLKQLTTPANQVKRAVTRERLEKAKNPFPGGMNVEYLKDAKGNPLPYQVVETNMRIELAEPLVPGKSISFQVGWNYLITDAKKTGDRAGFEYFPEDGNYIFEIAQFYPRMCTYTHEKGWQNQPYISQGEFALEFGDFEVEITVPKDHIVAATGELVNEAEVLTEAQQDRLKTYREKNEEVGFVVTPAEARSKEQHPVKGTQTWKFSAQNVRDFAFASSRKFIWDVAVLPLGKERVTVQSFYPAEGQPLWDKYATHAAMHTLKTCSRLTVDYPYPTCNVVHGAVWGMEYPMLSFCGGRPKKNGEYSYHVKYAMLGVVMHEVGHNFFPMIVNSDERTWAWMDEGLNSFCVFVAEQEFEAGFPSRRGFPGKFAPSSKNLKNPIMTPPESMIANATVSYEKTATALNILRETILGRELFDRAFKTYAERWAFKHPEPADFFRTMEEVGGKDLDWFWRGWFYGTDPVDISIKSVKQYIPSLEVPIPQTKVGEGSQSFDRYAEMENRYVETRPFLKDQYSWEGSPKTEPKPIEAPYGYLYLLEFENLGGCISPMIFRVQYANGQNEVYRLPAEVWMKNNTLFRKEIATDQPIEFIEIDPFLETADIDIQNNVYPPRIPTKPVKLY